MYNCNDNYVYNHNGNSVNNDGSNGITVVCSKGNGGNMIMVTSSSYITMLIWKRYT